MASKKENILFVDDEVKLLQGLRRYLRPMRNQWHMTFLSNGKDALAFLEDNTVDVVISDMRMPEMTGSELLSQISHLYPDIVRIMLSGYTEIRGILNSVGPSHQFLAKPCEPEVLMETIRRSLNLRAQLAKTGLRSYITGIQNVPTLPDIYREFMEEVGKPSASTESISAIIDRDVGLFATILKLTNSAYFSLPTRITSTRQAVQFLGLDTIRSLVVVASLFEAIDLNDDKLPFHRQLGNEALAIASIAKSIAGCEGSSQGKIDECFCAGSLSQLGNILFLLQPPELFESYREVSRVNPTKRLELERDLYGTTHAEVGAYLLSIWGFSHRIVGAVLHHHNPAIMDEKNFDTTTIVHIAESLMSGTDNCLDEAHIERLGKGHRISVWRETAAEIIENGVVS